MTIKAIKRVMRDYREIINPRNKTIGSVLKHHRKEKGLTLEETARNDCSVSYLSKVENNQLIPSDAILNQIIKRLDLPIDIFDNKEKDTSYINEIIKLDYVPEHISKEYSGNNDYQAKLVSFAKLVFSKEKLNKVSSAAEELLSYYSFFTDTEMTFYLYLVMMLNYYNEQYEMVVLLFKEMNIINDELDMKIKSQLVTIKSLYRLERFGEANVHQSEIMKYLYNYNSTKEIIELKQYELTIIARCYETDRLEQELNNIKNNININYDYIWFNHYYYYKKDYVKAYDYIIKIHEFKEHYYLYYLMVLDKLKLVEELKGALSKNELLLSKLSSNIIKKYLNIKYFEPDILNKVKKELIRINIITNEFFIIKYIYNELINELTKKFQYKESLELATKVIELHEENSKIILH